MVRKLLSRQKSSLAEPRRSHHLRTFKNDQRHPFVSPPRGRGQDSLSISIESARTSYASTPTEWSGNSSHKSSREREFNPRVFFNRDTRTYGRDSRNSTHARASPRIRFAGAKETGSGKGSHTAFLFKQSLHNRSGSGF